MDIRRQDRTLLSVVALSLVAGLFAVATLFDLAQVSARRSVEWWEVAAFAVLRWYIWLAIFPFIVTMSRRFPIETRQWPKNAAMHLAISLSVALAILAFYAFFRSATGWVARPGGFFSSYRYLLFSRLHWYVLAYWGLLGIAVAIDLYWRVREREFRTLELEGQLAKAQLTALRMQLQPHFLFNTLNHAAEQIHLDPEGAEKMILRLSDLLRTVLEAHSTDEVPLREEMRFLEKYLEIQRLRFRDRLKIDVDLSPEALDVPVPTLMLQPIVENSIRHGIARRPGAGAIQIRGSIEGARLTLQIRDDGEGLTPEPAAGAGVGIANTKNRLRQLYGDEQAFEIRSNEGAAGATVTVQIPVRGAKEP